MLAPCLDAGAQGQGQTHSLPTAHHSQLVLDNCLIRLPRTRSRTLRRNVYRHTHVHAAHTSRGSHTHFSPLSHTHTHTLTCRKYTRCALRWSPNADDFSCSQATCSDKHTVQICKKAFAPRHIGPPPSRAATPRTLLGRGTHPTRAHDGAVAGRGTRANSRGKQRSYKGELKPRGQPSYRWRRAFAPCVSPTE